MLAPIPEDPLELEEYQRNLMTAEELAAKAASDQAAADAAKADAAKNNVDPDYAARLRREAAEARAEAEAARNESKALKDAEAARVAKNLEDQKEFEKLAAHHKEKAELAERERDEANKRADSARDSANAEVEKERTARKLEAAASKHGLRDLDDVSALDMKLIRKGDNGELLGVDEEFEDLKKRKEHYFKVDGRKNNGGTPPPRPSSDDPAPKDVYAMTDADFNREFAQLGKGVRA